MLKTIEVTFIENNLKKFEDVEDDTMQNKGSYIRFKNNRGETIYINSENVLMFVEYDQK